MKPLEENINKNLCVLWLGSQCLSMVLKEFFPKLGMMAHTSNPSTREVETGRSKRASLVYIGRLCSFRTANAAQ